MIIKTKQFENVDEQKVVLKIKEDESVFCMWAIENKLYFSKFRDFEWECINNNALLITCKSDILINDNCLDIDDNGNCYFLYRAGNYLWYSRLLQNELKTSQLICEGDAKSFSVLSTSDDVFIGYIYGTSGAQDRLVLRNIDNTRNKEVVLSGDSNSLVQIKQFGNKIYLLWVETESDEYASSSSSYWIYTSSHSSSNSTTSESTLSTSSEVSTQSTSLSSQTMSNNSSSSTDAAVYSYIKYMIYDILTDTFDTAVPGEIVSTRTTGEITSFDFNSNA